MVEQKERDLSERESQLKLREQELLIREGVIDSLNGQSDTIGTYEPLLAGNWTVTMECIETSCEGSAIGDKKTEHWRISYRNKRVIAQAFDNNKVIRTYSGLFKDNTLSLIALKTPDPETHINVVLIPHPDKANLMEGQRVINQGGKCRIVYQLKAEKI